MNEIPKTQHAIQYVGKDEIVHNTSKPVDEVGPTQILLKTEACGICFSDTKLLHQFDVHPRKVDVIAGLTPAELAEIPSYRPNAEPTVPGHEPVCRVVAVGDQVTHYKVGDRVLVQADWKHMRTPTSNGSFGYAFEGALQEYVLVDERIVVHNGEEFMIRVSDGPTAAQVGLIEPWATVENAYAWKERQHRKEGGSLLVVADGGAKVASLASGPKPATVTLVGDVSAAGLTGESAESVDALEGKAFDDIVYFGADPDTVEKLAKLLGTQGILNTVLGGKTIERKVTVDVGRVHYDYTRYVGTTGDDPEASYAMIPEGTEVRGGDKMLVIGAAGPMGLMHTMRAVVLGLNKLSVDCSDVSDDRLAHLAEVVQPVADDKGVPVKFINSATEQLQPGYTYVTCMVPSAPLLSQGIDLCGSNATVNLFAGLPIGSFGEVDMQGMIERGVFLAGTSGSDIADMQTVLDKVERGDYDNSVSLDAVTGMAGFKDAIQAVMDRTSGGKIIVYPALHDLPYTRVVEMEEKLPEVAGKLKDGRWTLEAEQALLATGKQ